SHLFVTHTTHPALYPLSLHDALPIWREGERHDCRDQDRHGERDGELAEQPPDDVPHEKQRDQHGDQRHREADDGEADLPRALERSEEHTSELQSPYDLVCRLLLEKKK